MKWSIRLDWYDTVLWLGGCQQIAHTLKMAWGSRNNRIEFKNLAIARAYAQANRNIGLSVTVRRVPK